MRKKLIAGAAVLALLMNTPQVKADDDIVVFGGEFEEEKPAPKKKPEPIRESLPEEINKPFEEPTTIEEVEEPSQVEEPPEFVEPLDEPPIQPADSEEPAQVVQPTEEPTQPEEPSEFVEPLDEPPIQPADSEELASEETFDTWNDEIVFDDLNNLPEQVPADEPIDEPPAQIQESPIEINRPFQPVVPPTPQQPTPAFNQPQPVVKAEEPARKPSITRQATLRQPTPRRQAAPQKELKMLKPRFVKLAVDETYTYYLDKNSVQWKKMPYSSSEYIADVWIRMVEREAKPLSDDMAAYGADNFNAEVSLAAEQGYQYTPDDLQVLRSQAYVLEHYYLRPKTNQIQFLCELEVFGRPQNAINERAYDYKNWENLVPGSVESIIYATVLKTIGTKKATERGHMTFIDMLEEYGRISLR